MSSVIFREAKLTEGTSVSLSTVLSGLEVSGGIRTKSGGLRINRSVSADLAVSVHLRDGGLVGFRGDGPADATTQST